MFVQNQSIHFDLTSSYFLIMIRTPNEQAGEFIMNDQKKTRRFRLPRMRIFCAAGALLFIAPIVDVANGRFILPLYAHIDTSRSDLCFALLTGLCALAAFILPLKRRLLFFLYLSVLFIIRSIVWGTIGQFFPAPTLPFEGSVPFMIDAYHQYLRQFSYSSLLSEIFSSGAVAYIYCLLVMSIAVGVKISVRRVIGVLNKLK